MGLIGYPNSNKEISLSFTAIEEQYSMSEERFPYTQFYDFCFGLRKHYILPLVNFLIYIFF